MGYYDEYLEHHGIKGQRWGVRRFQNADGSLTSKGKSRYGEESDLSKNVKSTRSEKRAANKEFNKSFNKAYNKSSNVINHLTKKGRQGLDDAWEDAQNKAENYRSKNQAYKDSKKAFKEQYQQNLKETREKATVKDKVIYNDATRKRAAKLMTKYKDMDYNKATEAAKKEAKRNTAIVLAAYGAIQVGALVASSKMSNSRAIYGPGEFLTNVGSSLNYAAPRPHTGKLKL